MARHYLDHASTVPPRPEVLGAMREVMGSISADPGRVHLEGRIARSLIEESREQVALLLGVRPRQVVFTSSGTEAINAAVWGATRAAPRARVLCSGVEHSAVRDASSRLAPVDELRVDRLGRIDTDSLKMQLKSTPARPALVHCQWGNHEVGTLQPVEEIVGLCHDQGVLVHVDAAAACGHVATQVSTCGADLISVSAHKLGGPPGVGVLVIKSGLVLEPLIVGGQQERARRAGFENLPAMAGFAAAANLLSANSMAEINEEISSSRSHIEQLIAAATAVDGVSLVGDPDSDGRLPHIACFGVEGVEAEPVVIGMDRAGISVHSGSACSSESLEPSPVLEAMGVEASRSLRLSVGWSTNSGDVEAFADAFGPVVRELRALRA